MTNLFAALEKRVPDNAKLVVATCSAELPEYAAEAGNARTYARMLDFAVFIRLRTLELVTGDQPLTADDLAAMTAIGEERGKAGMSHPVARRVLALHAAASLREIHEASGPADLPDAMHMLAWLGRQGTIGQQAYHHGFLAGQRQYLPVSAQVRQLVDLALAGDPAVPAHAANLGLPVPENYLVLVVRTPDPGDLLGVAWHRHRVPATWREPDELIALLPADKESTAAALVRDIAGAAGTATGPATALAETVALARRVSQVASPGHLYTVADVFIELGVAELPEIDSWLRDLTRRLATGTELLPTLDAFYRNDLDRSRAAAAVNVHPRTLDYRLRRAQELTGIDPRGTNGIRVFTTAMSRARAQGW